jgi:hypothetical protein
MAERSKALDWNSSKPRKGFRGFESHSLRQISSSANRWGRLRKCENGGYSLRRTAFPYRAPCKLKFAQNPLPLLVQWEMTVHVWKS